MVKKESNKLIDTLQKDVFAIIWIIFIAIIVALTFYGKEFIKELIIVSIMFLAFFMLEPFIRMSHGSKISHYISGGKHVPVWKRFPIFFIAIVIVFTIKHYLEIGLDEAFPTESVNIIFVAFWIISIFSIYYLIISSRSEEHEKHPARSKRTHRRH